ncbi:MAG: division/cell wall cluster transcriptional repressor MraZ [Firmicutes bacterium]|nr:division/cell wall cluster transcriptional repressor MraZ [Bacillota bacterium]
MGTDYNSIDERNRMIIPAKHREEIGEQCVLTKGFDPCLYIYTMEEWERLVEKLKELKGSKKQVRNIIRHFSANAERCDVDKKGRILLTPELKKYAGITKDLAIVGAVDKIEIWAKDAYEKQAEADDLDEDAWEEIDF